MARFLQRLQAYSGNRFTNTSAPRPASRPARPATEIPIMMSRLPMAVENDAARQAAGVHGDSGARASAKGGKADSGSASGFSIALAQKQADGKTPPPDGENLPPADAAPAAGSSSGSEAPGTEASRLDAQDDPSQDAGTTADNDGEHGAGGEHGENSEHEVDLYAHLPESLRALYELDGSPPGGTEAVVPATPASLPGGGHPPLAQLAAQLSAQPAGHASGQPGGQASGQAIDYASRGLPEGGPGAQSLSLEANSLARVLGVVRALHGMPAQAPGEGGGEFMRALAASVADAPETRTPASLLAGAAMQAPATSAGGSAASGTTGGAVPTPPSLSIPMAPDRPGWGEAVGQRVLWMVSNKSQVAQLRLNPPDLGPVEVRVRTDDDGVRLSMAAGNNAVREALESAAPRLREMFAAEGLQLDHVDIGHQGSGQGDGENAAQAGDADEALRNEAHGEPAVSQGPESAGGAGLVDCFI